MYVKSRVFYKLNLSFALIDVLPNIFDVRGLRPDKLRFPGVCITL